MPTLWACQEYLDYLYFRRFTAKVDVIVSAISSQTGTVLHFCSYFRAKYDNVFSKSFKKLFQIWAAVGLFTVWL